ncbi:MAG: hypothetical protein J7480_01140, partial [Microbacteriaceae bacterium]|nr:hypothetical protein [Microbacteriaceae bacterium]
MSAADREALLAERIGERIEDARGAYLARAVLTGVVPTEAEVERELARALARPDAAIARCSATADSHSAASRPTRTTRATRLM